MPLVRDGDRQPVDDQDARRSRAWTSSRASGFTPARWPDEGVDFTGKRVAVIGTGSTAIQAIPQIARQASQLYVFQRTPNYSMPAQNRPLTAEEQREIRPRLRAAAPVRRAVRRRRAVPGPDQGRVRGHAGRAPADVRGGLEPRRHQLAVLRLHRLLLKPGRQQHRGRVHAPEDPRDRRATPRWPRRCAPTSTSAPSARASTSTTSRPTTATTST